MLDPEDSALLLKLGDAASHKCAWDGFLKEFAIVFRTDAVQLFVPPQLWGWDKAGGGRRDVVPMPLLFSGLRAGRVYSGEELRDRALAQEMKWLGKDNRAVGLPVAHGPACLVLRRDKLAFRGADTARLAAFAPHIAQALDQWHATQAAALQLNRLHDMARRVGVGGVALDVARSVILDVDQTAARLLLENGLEARAVLDSARTHAAPAVVALGAGLEMLVLADEVAAGQVMAYLRQTDAPLPDAARIAAVLGISRAEARLARALGEGASLNAAAARLGLSVETARNYSKRIYARSGLRGQAALVRYLWCSALLLAR